MQREKAKYMAAPILDWIMNGIPKSVSAKLFDDVGFIYEAQLAKMELSRWWSDPDAFRKRAAYFEEVHGQKTYHYFISDIKGKGQIGRTCQYLTHWFYPYKAKFHPQMIKAIINWMGLKKGDVLLDPFVGSGTALIEAKTIGIDSIGIDINPICTLQSKVKCNLLDLSLSDLKNVPEKVAFHTFDRKRRSIIHASLKLEEFIPSSSEELSEYTSDERVVEFYQLCYLYALSDFTYIKKDMWKAFKDNLNRILKTVEKWDALMKKLDFDLGKVDVKLGDAREIRLKTKVNGIITSPPYSIAVDYIKMDLHALDYLVVNPEVLVKDMVGLRGKGQKRVENYYSDMTLAFEQMYDVLEPNSCCAVIIGDVTFDGKRLPIHQKYIEFALKAGFSFVDIIRRPILGGFARLRYEYIILFRKD